MNQVRPIIQVNDLHKSFGAQEVLRGITLAVESGAVVSLIGASGSGKSTFLRCLNYLERPSSGEIIVDGETIGDPHRVMAGSDCGFETIAGRGRVAEDVVWAKFKSMAEGAKLASSRLF